MEPRPGPGGQSIPSHLLIQRRGAVESLSCHSLGGNPGADLGHPLSSPPPWPSPCQHPTLSHSYSPSQLAKPSPAAFSDRQKLSSREAELCAQHHTVGSTHIRI